MASDYQHGHMPVDGHHKTYGGFMVGSIWGTGLILVICLYAILTFACGFAWLPSLIGTFIVGVLFGLALKMKMGWYATLVALTVFAGIISVIISLLA